MVNMCLKATGGDTHIDTGGDPDADFKYFKLVPEYIWNVLKDTCFEYFGISDGKIYEQVWGYLI